MFNFKINLLTSKYVIGILTYIFIFIDNYIIIFINVIMMM